MTFERISSHISARSAKEWKTTVSEVEHTSSSGVVVTRCFIFIVVGDDDNCCCRCYVLRYSGSLRFLTLL